MRDIDLLKLQADAAYSELLETLAGVTEHQAWAKVECVEGEYMHAEGSILSTVMHIASGKFIYGSVGYRDTEIRWRDIIRRIEEFWPSWDAAMAYLAESQIYWMNSWAEEEDLERLVTTHTGRRMPSWQAIWTVTNHDAYHGGQIQMLRSTLSPSETPPPDEMAIWHQFCSPSPNY